MCIITFSSKLYKIASKLVTLLSFILISNFTSAQKIDQSNINESLSENNLEINWPIELKTKIKFLENNTFLPKGINVYYPTEKVQIIIEVEKINSTEIFFPNIKNGTRLAHYSANEEDSIISLHTLGREELELLNAEWGTLSFFRPKKEFMEFQYCQLLSFYTSMSGQVFVYFLFNDEENRLLDHTFSLIKFIDD